VKRKLLTTFAILLAVSFVLSACGGPATVVVTELVGGEIVERVVTATPEIPEQAVILDYNWGTEPPTGDPALATDTTSGTLIGQLFMSLTNFDVEGNVIPWLASEWSVSDDGLVWTFNLRVDVPWVRYNTGTTEVDFVYDDLGNQRFANAYDVVYGIKRTLDPATASDYAYILYIIQNAEAVNNGEEGFTIDDVGVRAVDDYTVEFTLEAPAGYFPSLVAITVADPVPQWTIEEALDNWIEPGTIVTNGPYVMTEWIHGAELNLRKNPYWPEADSVQIEEVHGVMIVEASTAFAMYQNGELDTAGLPLAEVDRINADPVLSAEYHNVTATCTYYYGFTNNKPPFDDVRVRQAFSMSVDKQTLVDAVLKGGQVPAGHFAVPGMFGSPEVGSVGLPYDPEAASALLQEYLDEKGMTIDDLDILLMHNTSEGHARIAAAIQQMWADNLGVTVSMENQEWRVFLQTLKNTTPIADMPHVWRQGWCADYPDENNWVYEVFHATAGSNRLRRGCTDPDGGCLNIELQEFDELTDQARVEQDPEIRKQLYFEAERLLSEVEVAYIPIYYYTTMQMTKPYLDRDYASLGPNHIYWWVLDMEAKLEATQ
jgi:oligopeptide transport system substrate-binding protein